MPTVPHRSVAVPAATGRGSSERRASSDTDRSLAREGGTGRIRGVIVAVLVGAFVLGQSVTPAVADGITWTARTPAADIGWMSVAYGDGLWVAVAETGSGNRVMTSPDGISWTGRTSAPDDEWESVAYGDGLWVAVADQGPGTRVMTSEDGITWTARTPAAAFKNWRSVAYGNELWVAVAESGGVMTSPDGITWTARTAAANNDWWSVAYGNGLWVAVSRNGSGNKVMTSEDGITWTTQASAADNNWRSVAYGGGLWVAVADSGTGNRVMTSPDGITWTARTSAADINWYSVAYGDGLWVATATSGSGNRVMTSPDGITWTTRTSAADNRWYEVAYGDGLWVAVANNGSGNRVMTSGAMNMAATPAVVPPSVSCVPSVPIVAEAVVCSVTGGDPGIDILWRAAHDLVFAEAGVTLDSSGSGEFSFTVPAAAVGSGLSVELVEWTAPVSLGVVGGPVPGSVPAGDGPVPVWSLALLALVGVVLLRRGMRAQA